MKIAAMDLGTNTFRLLISENNSGNLIKLYRETNITRLGEYVSENRIINQNAITRSLEILRKYKTLSDEYSVKRVVAAGTSAFRNASNKESLVSLLKKETGIEIMVISGQEEAELTVRGVLQTLDSCPEHFYHMDIGGGSTEISLIVQGNIEYSVSFDLGVVSMAEQFKEGFINIDEAGKNVARIIKENLDQYHITANLPLIATSGTPIVIACILNSVTQFDSSRVNGMKISFTDVKEIKQKLIKDSNYGNLNKYGDILKGREDLIVPGSIILTETMKYLGNDSMIISESGLLEGLSVANV